MSAIQCDYIGCSRPATAFTSVANIKACKAHRSIISFLTLSLKSIREQHLACPPVQEEVEEKKPRKKRKKNSPIRKVKCTRSSLVAIFSRELLRFCGFFSEELGAHFTMEASVARVEKFTELYLQLCAKEETIDSVAETVVTKLIDHYYTAIEAAKSEKLLQSVKAIRQGDKLTETVVMQLVRLYSRKEVKRYADAENVLNSMLGACNVYQPELRYRIIEKLIRVLILQISRAKKETLAKYDILRSNATSQRLKKRPLATLLVSVENLKLHRQLEEKMSVIDSTFETITSEECAACLYAIGEFYKRLSNYQRAQTNIERGLEILKPSKKGSELAVRMILCLGKIYQNSGQPKKASHLYTGPTVTPLIIPCQRAAKLYLRIGDFFFDKEKFIKAKDAYERSISLLQSASSSSFTAAEVHLRLVSLYCRKNVISRAKESYSQAALILANLIADTPKACARHRSITEMLKLRQKTISTRIFCRSALASFTESRDLNCLKAAITQLPSNEKDSDVVVEMLERAMRGNPVLASNPDQKAIFGLILAHEFLQQRKWAKAEPLYFQGLDAHLKLRSHPKEIAEVALTLASACIDHEGTHTTLKYVEISLKYCIEADPNSLETASLYEALGNNLNSSSMFQGLDAAKYYQSAYDIYRTHPESQQCTSDLFRMLLRIYRTLEVHEKLEKLYLDYLSLLPASSAETGELYALLAGFYHSHSNTEKSEKHQVKILVKIGKAAFRKGNIEEAKRNFDEALSLVLAAKPAMFRRKVDFFWENIRNPIEKLGTETCSLIPLYRFYQSISRFDIIQNFFKRIVEEADETQVEKKGSDQSESKRCDKIASSYSFCDTLKEMPYIKVKRRVCLHTKKEVDYKEKELKHKKAIAKADKENNNSVYNTLILIEKLRKTYSIRSKSEAESYCLQSIYEVIIDTGYNHSTVTFIDEILNACWSNSHQDHKASMYQKRDLNKRITVPLKFAISIEIFLVQHFSSVGEHEKAVHFANNAVELCFQQRSENNLGVLTKLAIKEWEKEQQKKLLKRITEKHIQEKAADSLIAMAYWNLAMSFDPPYTEATKAELQNALLYFNNISPTYKFTQEATLLAAKKFHANKDYDHAYKAMQDLAEQLLTFLPLHESTAKACSDLGTMHLVDHRLEEAETMFLKAFEIYYKLSAYSSKVKDSLINLGDLYYEKKNYSLAERKFKHAILTRMRKDPKDWMMKFEPHLKKCYFARRKFEAIEMIFIMDCDNWWKRLKLRSLYCTEVVETLIRC